MEIVVIVGAEYTVTEKLVVAVSPPPSATVSVMVVVPTLPELGVTVTVRDAPAPAKTILAVDTNEELLEAPVTANAVSAVKSSPTVKANAGVAEFIVTI